MASQMDEDERLARQLQQEEQQQAGMQLQPIPAAGQAGDVQAMEVEVPNPAFDMRVLREQAGGGAQRRQAQPVGNVRAAIERNPRGALCSCCVAVSVILAMFLVSLGSLQPTEFGLSYNRFNKAIDESYTYRGGRHFIGPANTFLVFPATLQTLEFSNRSTAQATPLETRTGGQAGLKLTLHVAFQYRLKRDQLPELYKLANIYYEALFMKVARDVLLKAAAEYNAQEYWEERPKVGAEMFRRVNAALETIHATCTGLQILIIELPDQYENSIVATQVRKQGIKTQQNVQQSTLVRAEIGVMVAEYANNITVTLSSAVASATLAVMSAEARASKLKIDADNIALGYVHDALGLTPASLVDYQRNFAYTTLSNATFLFGVSSAVVVLGDAATPGAYVPPPAQPPSTYF